MEELERIDPFQGQDEHILEKASKEDIKKVKLKSKYVEDNLNAILKQIEQIFQGNF